MDQRTTADDDGVRGPGSADIRGQLRLEHSPWPRFADDEIAAAEAVLRSGKVNSATGEQNRLFQAEYASASGAGHGLALCNGTLALELALRAMEIAPGDEVIVTPRSYFASVSAVIMLGAKPVFADVDRDSQNMTVRSIERAITPRTRAIMPVHLAGWPCDMPAIMELASAQGLTVLEDCAQAHGAKVAGRAVGSFGDAGAFSFCQDKIITTGGEGGMMLTSDDALQERAWSFRNHGKNRVAIDRADQPPGYRYVHESIGSNFRMSEVQAAIGRAQLRKLDDWTAARRAHAAIYRSVFTELPALRVPAPQSDVVHACYKFYAFVETAALRAGWDRDRILKEVAATGVPCFIGSCPEIYREKALRDLGLAPPVRLPVARELGETSLMLLVHPTLSPAQVRLMADTVAAIVKRATK